MKKFIVVYEADWSMEHGFSIFNDVTDAETKEEARKQFEDDLAPDGKVLFVLDYSDIKLLLDKVSSPEVKEIP